MPYIAVKMYPKDDKIKKELAEKLCETVVEVVGCPPQAVTISLEEVAPADWDAKVREPEILPNMDKMWVVGGEKKF